jgi:hypothetical protein
VRCRNGGGWRLFGMGRLMWEVDGSGEVVWEFLKKVWLVLVKSAGRLEDHLKG